MLFELAVASGVLYFGASGQGFRIAARNAGRVLGRAAGSLRRARAEVDRLQARAESLGGAELSKNRADIKVRLQQLNAIRAETSQLLSMHGGGGGAHDASSFTDAELASALGVAIPPPTDSLRQFSPSSIHTLPSAGIPLTHNNNANSSGSAAPTSSKLNPSLLLSELMK
jgi:hypothetical protein